MALLLRVTPFTLHIVTVYIKIWTCLCILRLSTNSPGRNHMGGKSVERSSQKDAIYLFHRPHFLTSLWCLFLLIFLKKKCHLSITTVLQASCLLMSSQCLQAIQNIYYKVLDVKFAIHVCAEFYVYIYGESLDGVKCFILKMSAGCKPWMD